MSMKSLAMQSLAALAALVATAGDHGFNFQAELRTAAGGKPASRDQTVEIRLWKSADGSGDADLLWGRTYEVHTDESGLFNQEVSDSLGTLVADWPSGKAVETLRDVFSRSEAGSVYLGIKVKGSAGEIAPRQRLLAVPFAGRATDAKALVGDVSGVEGLLRLSGGATLSSGGLVLPADSNSRLGTLSVGSVTSKTGSFSAKNVTVGAKITGADGKEVVAAPVNAIILWTKGTPPDGDVWEGGNKSAHWAICDGQNGTPDLRGRFVVGAGQVDGKTGTNYGYGATGGEETHVLSANELPSHVHSYTFDDLLARANLTDDSDAKHYMFNNSGTAKRTTDSAGGGKAHENRPPYYALYYIMRIR